MILNMPIKNPTEEQNNIIQNIKEGYNIIIQAGAGCAKTTTCLQSIRELQDKKCLFLLFNRMLKIDLQHKVKKYFDKKKQKDIIATNYHSLIISHYGQDSGTYYSMIDLYKNGKAPTQELDFDIIFIDEAQDLDMIICTFLNKVIKDIYLCKKKYPQLVFIGDKLQQIYDFKGSKSDYFLNAMDYFHRNEIDWKILHLKTTFRLNNNHVKLINDVFYNENVLNSNIKLFEHPYLIQEYNNEKIIN